VRAHFRPEFLNRLDEWIIFSSLSRQELMAIVDLQIEKIGETLAGRRMSIEVTDAAKRSLVDAGYDPAYGARPLKRILQKKILDRLSLEILEGRLGPGDMIRVDDDGGGIMLGRAQLCDAREPV
jgi:ATP-dependent Clp protease ATP-binding subunit ClpB